ncbi:DUF1642 domain-containing protein [Lactococcus petauri]|uniref:DUF1642 domain-containing protein n=1 Tax=Lactococcus petauri TaxID=1940789 RepID=UPI00254C6DCD|nr:DUF1642 domain-containing protein [Lactococcus petauri]
MSREKSIKTINIHLEKLTALELEEVTVLTNALLAVRNVREEHQNTIASNKALEKSNLVLSEENAKFVVENIELEKQIIELKSQLEKQQPEIPEFVAEYIKSTADPIHEMCAWSEHYGDNGGKCDDPELSKMLDWFGMNRNLFYKAVINGYTVAKEKRYEVVFLEDDTTRQILMENNAGYYFIEEESENYGYWKQDFTEMEIKEINEKFWQLSVPVKDEQIEV